MLSSRELVAELGTALRIHWGVNTVDVAPHDGGMNSTTALVTLADGRFFAKWVPADEDAALRRGASVARTMASADLRSGDPLPTIAGDLAVELRGGSLALLREVPGEPLTGRSETDQIAIARTLARAHEIGGRADAGQFFPWLQPEAPDLDVERWVRPAIRAVRDEFDRLGSLSWGLVHTDPSPEAFRRDPAGDVGLIDWTGATEGPLLYDVASGVMYLGGRERAVAFLREYRAAGPVDAHELEEHLDTLSRFRAAVQVAYFARRLAGGDLTGISDQADNHRGFEEARRMLAQLGVPT